MLVVTKNAAAFLKVAKAAEGARRGAGIRLRREAVPDESENRVSDLSLATNPILTIGNSSRKDSAFLWKVRS
jgi:hypothetical protein